MDYPRNYLLVHGHAYADFQFLAIDRAYRRAGIGDYNLVRVSSILPEGATRKTGHIDLRKGTILYCALAQITSNAPDQILVSAVAVARVIGHPEKIGVIMEYTEHHKRYGSRNNAPDAQAKRAVKIVEQSARQAMIDRGYGLAAIEVESIYDIAYTGKLNNRFEFTTSVSAVALW